jgi:hypothetical protein
VPLLSRGPAQHAAPSTYQLAAGEAFEPESVTATFDGSGAAGSFMPTLSVYAQSGELIARSPAASLSAGDSAEVTFAPLLRAAASAAAGGAPFAVGNLDSGTVASSASFTTLPMDPTNLVTDDPALYTVATVAGRTGLLIHSVGTYMSWFDLRLSGVVASPENFTCQAEIGGGHVEFGAVIGNQAVGATFQSGAYIALWNPYFSKPFAVDAATIAGGQPLCIQARQQTGVTLDWETSYIVFKISDDTAGF